jgi:hypothetical protein
MSCQPFFLKSIKIENEYKKAQNMFQQKQGCATSTTQSHSDNSQKQDLSEDIIDSIPHLFDSFSTQDKQADIADDNQYYKREVTVPDSSKLKAGIFTEVLTEILQNTSQETSGEYNECGAVAPMPLYTIFQTVMSDICPWTVSFTHLKSTENTMKVTLSTPNIAKSVEITKWKELTFFLPSELRRLSAKDFSPFTLQFLV